MERNDSTYAEDCAKSAVNRVNLANLQKAQSIVGSSEGRFDDDFYRTPDQATLSLLSMENFTGPIWEPACGDGAISKILVANNYEVCSTDLYDRGYGESGCNFFHFIDATKYKHCKSIITNPPYQVKDKEKNFTFRVEDWVSKSFQFDNIQKVALLLKTTALAGQRRSNIFQKNGLKSMLQFRQRLKMGRQGEESKTSCMIDFAWFVFERDYKNDPIIKWI